MKHVLSEHTVPIDLKEPTTPVIWVTEFGDDDAEQFFAIFNSLQSDDDIENIVIYIDSFGGAVDSLCTMIELVEASEKPVMTVAIGKSMSAGAILSAVGTPTMRWIGPNSRLMLHRLQGFVGGDTEKVTSVAKELIRMNDMWLKKIVTKSNMTWKEFNDMLKDKGGEWYLSAEEAVKYGFADRIGTPIIKEVRQIVAEVNNEKTPKSKKKAPSRKVKRGGAKKK
jgi:ATP-dependent Clp endopeptidase proteolytic subunit ClpP